MTTTIMVSDSALPTPNVRRITTSQPWEWLGAGMGESQKQSKNPSPTGRGAGVRVVFQ